MDAGSCPCGHTADIVERRIGEVDEEIAKMKALRSNLARLQANNDSCRASSVMRWRCQVLESPEGGDAR